MEEAMVSNLKAKTKSVMASPVDPVVKIIEIGQQQAIQATTIVVVPHGATVVGKKPSIA